MPLLIHICARHGSNAHTQYSVLHVPSFIVATFHTHSHSRTSHAFQATHLGEPRTFPGPPSQPLSHRRCAGHQGPLLQKPHHRPLQHCCCCGTGRQKPLLPDRTKINSLPYPHMSQRLCLADTSQEHSASGSQIGHPPSTHAQSLAHFDMHSSKIPGQFCKGSPELQHRHLSNQGSTTNEPPPT